MAVEERVYENAVQDFGVARSTRDDALPEFGAPGERAEGVVYRARLGFLFRSSAGGLCAAGPDGQDYDR